MASIDSSPGREKFGADPALYDFARPGYPAELFAWLHTACALHPGADGFEIGAGTGQATLPLLALPVRSILAIEPDRALAAHLRRAAGDDARLTIAVERFERSALAPGAFDFAVSATAFHWLRRMKAFAKIRGALRPGGHVAIWWNVYHDPASPDSFDDASAHLFTGLEEGPTKSASRTAFALDINARLGEMRAAGFSDVRHELFRQQVDFTPEKLAALYATFSRVSMAPDDIRTRLLSEVERIARESFGGSVRRTIVASAFTGRNP